MAAAIMVLPGAVPAAAAAAMNLAPAAKAVAVASRASPVDVVAVLAGAELPRPVLPSWQLPRSA